MSHEVPWIAALRPYVTAKHQAWERLDAKRDVLKLDWNESTVSPTPLVKERIVQALEGLRINWYPDVQNNVLKEKIAEYVGEEIDCVDYFASSDSLHEYVLKCFSSREHPVLMFHPTYDNFRASAEAQGAPVTRLPIQALYANASKVISESGANLVYLCNPNNPTGQELEIDDLEVLIRKFPGKLFVIDEAYYEFSGKTVAPLVSRLSNVICCRTFSKAFGIASFRVGYAVAHPSLISVLSKVKNHKNIAALSQIAAIACLDDVGYMRQQVKEVLLAKSSFALFLERCSYVMQVYRGGGNFLLFTLAEHAVRRLVSHLEAHDIFVREFQHIPNSIRITIGTPGQMKVVQSAFERFSVD